MRVEFGEDERRGRVVVKRADGPVEAARLRREADLLDVATHPGLVELLGIDDGAETVLRTVAVDGPSLDEMEPMDVEEVAGVLAAVASTVADLHALGLVHGALTPEHVILDAEGRPVLCSAGYGGLAGERRAVTDGPDEDIVLDPSTDVSGLGTMLTFLLDRANGRVRGAAGEALRRLAERAASPDGPDQMSARDLADAVHDTVSGARLPRRGTPPPSPPRTDPLEARRRQQPLERWRTVQPPLLRRPPRRTVGVAGVVLLVVAGGGFFALARSRPQAVTAEATPSPTGPVATATTAATAVSRPSTTVAPAPPEISPSTTRAARAGCPVIGGTLTADVDGDGCAEELRVADGVVEAGDARWAVGEADDVMAVGDWTCSGMRALAVLRPRTGEVFTFTTWATAGRDVPASMLARVDGGRSLRAADLDGDGCHELVIERATGAPAVLRATGTRP